MKTNTKRITHYIMALVSIVVLVLLDQITKHLVVLHLKDRSAYVLIKDVFQLEYLENRGGAFGVLQNQRIFFYISVLLITIAVIWFYHKVPIEHKYLPLRICAVLILSGAFGNCIDRIRLNYVVDFLYFKLINFPIFNVADIYVTVAAFLLVILILIYYKEDDLDRSRSYIQKIMKEGYVKVNQKPVKSNYRLSFGDSVEVTLPEAKEPDIVPENIPLDILYEDQDIIMINKPKQMVVHPAPGHYSGTLVNALMYHCGDELSGINGCMRPGIVHRIDMDTTGSLVVCKNDKAHQSLSEQLKVHSIRRIYVAIVHGNIKEDSGTVNAPIGRHPTDRKKMSTHCKNGRDAVTHYKVLERFGDYTYIQCELETGRTHQIRVHMASIGHPLVGDEVYGPKKCPFKGLQGQTLHARTLGIIHPTTGKYLEVNAPLPEYFIELLDRLRNIYN